MRLLLISNSTNAGEEYLEYPKERIKEFLGNKHVKGLFIPFAAVTFSYDDYELKVRERFREIGHDIISIHHYTNPLAAVQKASVIVVGGGNTWMLLKMLREKKLIDAIRKKVIKGTPYIGWSAGSNNEARGPAPRPSSPRVLLQDQCTVPLRAACGIAFQMRKASKVPMIANGMRKGGQ